MAAHFVNVTKAEMEALLLPQGFRPLALEGVTELVFAKRVDQDNIPLSLRVFTGIDRSGNSRSSGSDAIRVTIHARLPDGTIEMVGGSKLVKRTQGWANNLQDRIDTWQERLMDGWHQILDPPDCPACKSKMARREGKHGVFWGCRAYPDCKQTLPFKTTRHRTGATT